MSILEYEKNDHKIFIRFIINKKLINYAKECHNKT